MNLLIVADKAETKTYEAVLKAAPNTSVLGAVNRITPEFISLLSEKYNPHAILFDTDVPVVNSNVQEIINAVAHSYPYMKLLVLTNENDDYNYPAFHTIRGIVSNLEINKLIECMSSDTKYVPEPESDKIRFETNNKKRSSSKYSYGGMDKLSTRKQAIRYYNKSKITVNPILLASIAAGVVVLFIIVLVIIKSGSTKGADATPDEASTTVSETIVEETNMQDTTSIFDFEMPTLKPDREITEEDSAPTEIATTQEPTEKPVINTDNDTKSESNSSSENSHNYSEQSHNNSSGQSYNNSNSKNSSSNYSSINRGNSNSSNSSQRSSSNHTSKSVIPGDPKVSYDNNGKYQNSKNNSATGVKLSYSSKTLQVDDTIKIIATVSPSSANQSVTWYTSNSSVASVNNGTVTAKKVGTATITATTNNGKSSSCVVTVKNKQQTDDMRLSAKEYNLKVKETVTITLYESDNCNWTISNSSPVYIVKKDKNKITIRARNVGSTQIFAKDLKTSKRFTCDIHVTK